MFHIFYNPNNPITLNPNNPITKIVLFLIFFMCALSYGLAHAGQLEFDGVPVDITTAANEDLVIAPGTGGNTQIGVGTGTNTNATSNDDLHITGILETDGAAYLNSATTLGDSTSDTITVTGYLGSHVIPATDSTYDFGSSSLAWRYLYVDIISGYNAALALNPASGYSLTGSVTKNAATGNEVAYDLAATINKTTSGNYTGLKLNVTETSAPGTADKLFDLQVGGTSRTQVYNGTNSANYGLLSIGTDDWDGATAGFFAGSANGTQLAINAITGFTGNLVDAQVAGTSMFSVDANGNVTAAGTVTGTGSSLTGTTSNTFTIDSDNSSTTPTLTFGSGGTPHITTPAGNLHIEPASAVVINDGTIGTAPIYATAAGELYVENDFETRGKSYYFDDILLKNQKSIAVLNAADTADYNHSIYIDSTNNVLKFNEWTTFRWTNASADPDLDIMELTPSAGLFIRNDDANNSTVSDILSIRHSTSGVPAAGIGTGLSFQVEDAGDMEEQGSIDTVLTTVTNNAENADMVFSLNNAGTIREHMRIVSSGNVGIGTTTPTAYLHLKAGTATANTAPLKLTSGTLNTTAEAGAIEFLTDAYYGTITTGAARKTFAFTDSDITGFTGTLAVANGGTGATTFTANGLLYGNTQSAIQVTAQGGANTVLTANAGAPSFSASPTIGTSVTTPLVIGGTATTSDLSLQTTSGVGASGADMHFLVGNNGATEAMTILNNGRVGIGTTSPSYKLDVVGTGTQAAEIKSTSGTATFIADAGESFSSELLLLENGSGRWTLYNHGATDTFRIYKWATTAGDAFMINSDGNVSIGSTTAPASLFVRRAAVSTTQAIGRFEAAVTGFTGTGLITENALAAASSFNLFEAATDSDGDEGGRATRFLIRGDGNVGIGTTTPTAYLHLKAGTATANTAPLKLTSGTLNTTAEAGAIEFLTDAYYGTITTGASRKTFAFTDSNITGTATNVTGTVAVANGGTGATTFTANGLLYGNTQSAIQVTAQGGANTVLTANAGAPSFSASPTIGTSVTTPLVIGGTATTSDLSLQTTSGVGADGSDMHFLVGNNGATEAMTILKSGSVGIGTTNPQGKLSISGGRFYMETDSSGLGTPQIDIHGATNTNIKLQIGYDTTGDYGFIFAREDLVGSKPLVVQQGNFGIGETAPGSKLSVSGGATIGASYDTTAAPTNGMLIEGNVGIGTTTPTAYLHLKAGTATANTAPLKLTSGTLNTTAEAGAIEFLTDAYYGTITTGASRKTFAFTDSNITGTATNVTGTVAVANGGTGATTFTANGLLYGNTQSAIQVTAQGGANTVLTANAGAPSFSASPTIGTSVTTPLIIGGTATTSPLTLRSTSGVGTTGADIIFQTGNNGATEAMRILNDGKVGIGTTAPTSRIHGDTTLSAATGDEVAYTLAYTTNKLTSGNDTGLVINQTDTASPGTSLLMDLQVGGTSRLKINNATTPVITSAGGLTISATGNFTANASTGTILNNTAKIGFATPSVLTDLVVMGAIDFGAGGDARLAIQGESGDYILLGNNTIIGGTATTSDLNLQTTSGVGASGADMHFRVGNNGATEAVTILNDGKVGIGTTAPAYKLHLKADSAEWFARTTTDFAVSSAGSGVFIGVGADTGNTYGEIRALSGGGGSWNNLILQGGGGSVGIGEATPTARLHLKAGTATASTAPLKFTSGTNLTTAEAGAMEWDGTNLYISQTTGPTRKTLAYTDAASTTASGIAELATTAEVNTGTDTGRVATPISIRDSNYAPKVYMVKILGSTTDHTASTSVAGDFRMPFSGTIIDVGAFVDTAGTTGLATIDINESGVSILSTKITIDSTEKTSTTAATAPVISDTSYAADAIITYDIDVIQTTAAKGLTVWIQIIPDSL